MEIIQEYNINGKKIIYAKYTKEERKMMKETADKEQELPKAEEVKQPKEPIESDATE